MALKVTDNQYGGYPSNSWAFCLYCCETAFCTVQFTFTVGSQKVCSPTINQKMCILHFVTFRHSLLQLECTWCSISAKLGFRSKRLVDIVFVDLLACCHMRQVHRTVLCGCGNCRLDAVWECSSLSFQSKMLPGIQTLLILQLLLQCECFACLFISLVDFYCTVYHLQHIEWWGIR